MSEEVEVPHENGKSPPTQDEGASAVTVKDIPPPPPTESEECATPVANGVNGDHTNPPPQADLPQPPVFEDDNQIPAPIMPPPPLTEDIPPPEGSVDTPPPPPPIVDDDSIPPSISELPPPPADIPPPAPRVYSEEEQLKAASKIQKAWRLHKKSEKEVEQRIKSVFGDAPVSSGVRLTISTKDRATGARGRRNPTRGKRVESRAQTVPDKEPVAVATEEEEKPSAEGVDEEKPAAAPKPRPGPPGGMGGMPMFNPAAVQLKATAKTLSKEKEQPAAPFPLVKLKSAPSRPTDMVAAADSSKHSSMIDVSAAARKNSDSTKGMASSEVFAPPPPPLQIEEEPKPATGAGSSSGAAAESKPAATPAPTPKKEKKGLFGWLAAWLGKRPSKQELVDRNILRSSGDHSSSNLSAKDRKKKEKEEEKERKKAEKEKKKQDKENAKKQKA